ncbi:MAG: hypothetical protein IKG97_07265 [Lachnospiraceae bacterium]|nr:hypothetical protein [Lachnospiraceae bacterium]
MQDTEDYDLYRLAPRELVIYGVSAFLVLALLFHVFYDAAWLAVFALVPLCLIFRKNLKKVLGERRKKRLRKEFLSAVTLMGDALRSGYSAENAIAASLPELVSLWGPESDIVREWNDMIKAFRLNQTIEELLSDLGARTHVPEIQDFADVFQVTKRTGGRLSDVVMDTGLVLTEQFEAEEKVRTAVASRRFEQKIMDAMPLGILLYIRITSPDLIGLVYQSLTGRFIMTLCLSAYLGAVYWGECILKNGVLK